MANFNGLTGLARDDMGEFLLMVKSGKVHVAEDGMVSKVLVVPVVEQVGFMQEDQNRREKAGDETIESKVVLE